MIDFIMINKRWKSNILNYRSFAADIGSDHKLVLAKVRLRLKANRKQMKTRSLNVGKLKDPKVEEEYRDKLETTMRWPEDSSIEKIWSIIKSSIMDSAEKVLGFKEKKKQVPWISDEVVQLCNEGNN